MSLPIVPLAALALLLLGSSSSAQASAPPAPQPEPEPKPKKKSPPPLPPIDDELEAAAAAAAATLEAQMIERGGGKVLVMPPIDIEASVPLAPAPAPPAAPQAALAPKPQPPGYNPQAARREAASLAAHLKRAGRAGYDRRMLESWQKKAGLTPDRIYGGATRGALRFYGVADPPPAFFPPTQEIPFIPPEQR